ncbi:MAG: Dabb family protein [Opitutae bacterium]|nr:Dabb family protein [Opitutae bacterium]MBT6851951.1 Dabb family protein [Opitutae bacterium]MBT7742968.1 Dabb family protein [Opitutae bacterium]
MKNLLTIACAAFIALAAIEPLSAKSKEKPSGKAKTENKSKVKVKKIRHVVCFKFKEDATKQQIAKVEKAFEDLKKKKKIAEIESLEWGTNNSPEGLNKGFTHCFILTFADEKARDAYLPHPDHKAFGKVLKPILDDVFVIDFAK